MDVKAINEKRLSTVFPQLAEMVRTLIKLCSEKGISILVTQGLRTFEEQDALFAKRPKVTNAKGGQSLHNFGLAVDIVPLDAIGKADWDIKHPAWNTAADIGEGLGLEWGGRWIHFKDYPHFQLTGGVPLEELQTIYKEGGLASCWVAVTNSLT